MKRPLVGAQHVTPAPALIDDWAVTSDVNDNNQAGLISEEYKRGDVSQRCGRARCQSKHKH